MKILMIKTLKFQIFLVSILLLCIFAAFMWLLVRISLEERSLSNEYVIKNRITGHLNAAAGWQAIERGDGATIIGSGEGDSYPLFSDFVEMSKKGDSEVLQVKRHINKLLSLESDKTFKEQFNKWSRGYEALLSARPRIASNDISKEEWLNIATLNINNEFGLSNTTFLPHRTEEKILYLNTVLRPNIARLCEYAGRERALIGNTIASRESLSNETKSEIKRYRSIVDQSLGQILILKDLPSTSSKMKKAIEEFENEFLQSFQVLRENIFTSSKKQEEEIKASSVQITKRKAFFRNYLTGVSNDLLNLSNHENVKALAETMKSEEDAHQSEQLSAVENLFKEFSRSKRAYTQVRYLNNFGHETVCITFDGNTTTIIPGTQLHDKSDRDYFKKSVNLLPGSIYTSPLDHNMKNGRSEEVIHKPVIHFATPFFADGEKAGIIVFDLLVNTQSFLHADTEQEGKEDYILIDQNGFCIHHPDEAKEWGMVETLNKSHHNMRLDYPDAAKQILSGIEGSVRLASGIVIVYKPFFLNPETAPGNFWIIIKQVKEVEYPVDAPTWIDRATRAINTGLAISNIAGEDANAVMLEMESAAKRNIQIIFLTLFFAILILVLFIWWSRNRVLMPIQKLTNVTQKIAKGDFSYRVEVKSNNEIGFLSSSFNKMAADLQKSNADLCESEGRFRSIFEQAAVGIAHIDLKGKYLKVNKRFSKITGYTEQEILSFTYMDITHPDDIDMQLQARNMVLDGKVSSYRIEKRYIRKDGIVVWVNLMVALVRKPGGEPNYFVSVIEDITERRKAEEQIRKLSHAIEQSSSTVLITDTEGNIEYANPKFTQLTGYSLEEAIGKTPRILKSGKTSPEVYKELWNTIISGNEWLGELCNRKKNSKLFWEYVSISPVKNSEGIITNFIAVKDDITEQKQKDRLFLQQTRQAQMGEMISMIAHQWRQPLTSIGAIAVKTRNRLVLNKMNKEMIIESMKKIQDHVNYLSHTINDFRTFFKPDKPKEPVRVRSIIYKCLGLLSKPLEINDVKVKIYYKYDREIESYPNELLQVFINILRNIINIVKDRKIENAIVSIREYEKDGFIVIDITDNAGGISEDIKDNIFLPYFSTKEEKQGTGLGLYMCKTIIEEHCKGHITAQNIKSGAKFIIKLPIQVPPTV